MHSESDRCVRTTEESMFTLRRRRLPHWNLLSGIILQCAQKQSCMCGIWKVRPDAHGMTFGKNGKCVWEVFCNMHARVNMLFVFMQLVVQHEFGNYHRKRDTRAIC